MNMNEQMLQTYKEEAEEKIEELNEGLLEYEDEGTENGINMMFRASHTLKSSSASMGFDNISELAHSMEDVFDSLRNDEIEKFDGIFDLLYVSVDKLEELVDKAIENQEEPEADISGLLTKLEKAENGEKVKLKQKQAKDDPEKFEGVEEIKVDVERLDKLMNLVGELLINEKTLRRLAKDDDNDEMKKALDQLRRLGEDIRNETSKARMIPVSQVFSRFPRTVRDLSKRTNKEINFEVEGGDLRMDRTILEELGEPIIHILRNAVDHGIEPPEERKQNGKNPEGQITLKAEREGNEAVVSVTDDGRGVDVDKVQEKAIEKGVITENEDLSREEKLKLLFNSDMSTNDEVTELSGRGVGMSVVKTKAEELHGSYDITSTPGQGTTVEMRLPLSLAVVSCFLVRVGDQKYGIPIDSIQRTLDVAEVQIKSLEKNDVFTYEDGTMIPLKRLHEMIGEKIQANEENGSIIVVENGKQKAGLLIDEVIDVEDFVSKDLNILNIDGVGGVSILSDGKPVVILNVNDVIGEKN